MLIFGEMISVCFGGVTFQNHKNSSVKNSAFPNSSDRLKLLKSYHAALPFMGLSAVDMLYPSIILMLAVICCLNILHNFKIH